MSNPALSARNLAEALEIDRRFRTGAVDIDEFNTELFVENWRTVHLAMLPICSPADAVGLLDTLVDELRNSDGEFVDRIVAQIRDFLLGTRQRCVCGPSQRAFD